MDEDEWEFDEADDEPDDGDDFDDDEATLTCPCPECGAVVYEDAVQCPVCGNYITHQTNVWLGRPAWWIVLGVLGVAAAIAMLAGLTAW